MINLAFEIYTHLFLSIYNKYLWVVAVVVHLIRKIKRLLLQIKMNHRKMFKQINFKIFKIKEMMNQIKIRDQKKQHKLHKLKIKKQKRIRINIINQFKKMMNRKIFKKILKELYQQIKKTVNQLK